MAETSKSAADFRAEAAVQGLRRNGTAPVIDPMDEAMSAARKRMAVSAMTQVASSGDADALRAENSRLEMQIERHQLEEKLKEIKPDQGGQWRDYLTETVSELRGQIGQMQERQAEAERAVLMDRMQMLEAELTRQRELSAAPPENPMSKVREHLEEARALVEYITPPSKEVAPPPGESSAHLELRAWEKRVEIDQERWRAEREDRHRERMAEIQADQNIRQQALDLEREKVDRLERGMTTTLPRLLDLGEKFLQRFALGGDAAATAPDVAPAAAGYAVPPQVPPGTIVTPCQVCNYPVSYRAGWTSVKCPGCDSEYQLSSEGQSDPADPAAPEPRASAEPPPMAWEQHPMKPEYEEVGSTPHGSPFV